MRILRAACKNFKSLGDFDQRFGDVTVISGRNAEGKSSILDLISAFFVTDNSRHLLTVGAEEGWILAELEDEAGVITIRRTLSPEKIGNPVIKRADGTSPGAYGEFIKRILDVATLDPIRKVMSQSPKEQAAILLQTVPLELDHNEIVHAVADVTGLRDLPAIVQNAKKLPALDAIKSIEDYVYGARRDINRDAKLKRGHASELRASLGPAADKTDWAAEAERILGEMRKQAEEETRLKVDAERAYGAAKADVDRDIDAQIAALNQRRAKSKETLAVANDENLNGIEVAQRPIREDLKVQHDRATTNAGEGQRLTTSKRIADTNDAEAQALETRAEAMTKALKALATTREKLLEKLPVKGLRVEAGQAYLNNVPLQETNTAEQGLFWVRIAVMRAMKMDLGLVILEDSEHFDGAAFAHLLEACRASGLQFFIARVEDHELSIKNYESTVEVKTV
jgi:hypothetical protein